jgi:predicted nucleotidyltransferase
VKRGETRQQAVALAAQVAAQLGEIEGVVAVSLGGSLARGTAKANSDIDLGLYYDPERRPSLLELRRLARDLDDERKEEVLTEFGGWGPWIGGGGWLTVAGQRMDWLYRDLRRVRHFIDACSAGRPSLHRQGGHPHGFHTHIYLAEVYYCRPLYDPQGVLAGLQKGLVAYPPKLKDALIKTYLWQANFDLIISRKSAERGESYYVAGCFFECVSSLVQVLFALNERYFINQKGSVAETRTFDFCPPGFEETVTEVLGRAGRTPQELGGNLERLDALVRAVEKLAGAKEWSFS